VVRLGYLRKWRYDSIRRLATAPNDQFFY
jgi:hypothetical protein